MEKELSSEICIIENGQRQKLTKLHVVFRRAINSAMTKGPKDLILLMQKLDLIEKFSPKEILTKFADVDLDKLSLDEKLKMMKELIAESKPLDEYT